ncbi:MAG: 2,3-bisphosphoglycerate-independent phosphoglycerate mutase [Armatimonadota bacterium]|nr:2,3-bisphosphoglycerate-independent phosphoglycerate mutase [Armatimonadota bacterium]
MAGVPKAKAILLIGDGLGDRPVADLGGKTPLEAANKPGMDRIAAEGEVGLMDPIAPGVRAGSDTSHLAILGYDPYRYYTGRGPFEAAGIGMDVKQGDISFRCNFSTVDDSMTVIDRRAGRIVEGTDQLAAGVDGMRIEDVRALFKESVAHRGALVLRGPGLGADVSDTDPHEEGAKVHKCEPTAAGDEAAAKTARIVNEFVKRSYEALNNHPVNVARREQGLNPANIILPRGAGLAPDLRNFDERYGLKSACVAETGLIKGVAKYVGMTIVDAPGATGGLDSDIMAMGRAIVEALESHNFILCNVKGGDVAGHDNQPAAKVALIERLDEMVRFLLDRAGSETYIVLTSDHSTPVAVMDHSGDPVPIAFWGPGVRTDACKSFGERPAATGGVGRIRGVDVMNMITNLMGVQEKFGA